MCNAYGISLTDYCNRVHKGWDLCDILTKECDTEILDIVYDHKGTAYSSIVNMCEAYGTSAQVYLSRIKLGWSVQKALTDHIKRRKFKNKKPVYDFKGNAYRTQVEMCIHYGIDPTIYRTRIKAGWSEERALTTPTRSISLINDKDGTKYNNESTITQEDNCMIKVYIQYKDGAINILGLRRPNDTHNVYRIDCVECSENIYKYQICKPEISDINIPEIHELLYDWLKEHTVIDADLNIVDSGDVILYTCNVQSIRGNACVYAYNSNIHHICGTAHVEELSACEIYEVFGDATLTTIKGSNIRKIAGNTKVKSIQAGSVVASIAECAVISRIYDGTRITRIENNATVSSIIGFDIQVSKIADFSKVDYVIGSVVIDTVTHDTYIGHLCDKSSVMHLCHGAVIGSAEDDCIVYSVEDSARILNIDHNCIVKRVEQYAHVPFNISLSTACNKDCIPTLWKRNTK